MAILQFRQLSMAFQKLSLNPTLCAYIYPPTGLGGTRVEGHWSMAAWANPAHPKFHGYKNKNVSPVYPDTLNQLKRSLELLLSLSWAS